MLVWTVGHVKKREEGYVGKRMIEMAIPGKKERKAKEKMDRFGERRLGNGWSEGGRRS